MAKTKQAKKKKHQDVVDQKPLDKTDLNEAADTVAQEETIELQACDVATQQAEPDLADSPMDPVIEERDKYLEMLQRVKADFSNFQKRARQEQENARQTARQSLISQIIPVMDDLDRALQSASKEQAEVLEGFLSGVEIARGNLLAALTDCGVEEITGSNRAFDPATDQAMGQIPHPEIAKGQIMEMIRMGYRMGSRLIRPCEVLVSAGCPEDETSVGDEEDA